ncbi:hypothetical protein BC832DRAFT_607759 [Gaertneriomyces semiglobifer]|nr:hypothetical protein BC832DRAFT_607759 [Gaertneriomyces semiglobifer]
MEAPQIQPRTSSLAADDSSGPLESYTAPADGTKVVRAQDYAGVLMNVSIRFVGAQGLPKMDVIGTADPYLRATIDDCLSYCSSCLSNTLTPTWNEIWNVNNVPANARLSISVWDWDPHSADEFIGSLGLVPAVSLPLRHSNAQDRGTIYLAIHTTPVTASVSISPYLYTFAGPVRYSSHHSPFVGQLTRLNDRLLYTTFKIHLKGIDGTLPISRKQHWNASYAAARSIFVGPMSFSARRAIQAAHRMLYARTAANGFGVINDAVDFINLLMWHVAPGKTDVLSSGTEPGTGEAKSAIPKPAMYTYIIDDQCLRFSETGAAFMVDFASKHALHSNCSEYVRFAGEFHARPVCGWQLLPPPEMVEPFKAEQWELVFDNNSGTYAPEKDLLESLQVGRK